MFVWQTRYKVTYYAGAAATTATPTATTAAFKNERN